MTNKQSPCMPNKVESSWVESSAQTAFRCPFAWSVRLPPTLCCLLYAFYCKVNKNLNESGKYCFVLRRSVEIKILQKIQIKLKTIYWQAIFTWKLVSLRFIYSNKNNKKKFHFFLQNLKREEKVVKWSACFLQIFMHKWFCTLGEHMYVCMTGLKLKKNIKN